jgi:hypothetical protein
MKRYHIVRESDGRIWAQELQWDDDYGWCGWGDCFQLTDVPVGAAAIAPPTDTDEWMPCTDGCHATEAWALAWTEEHLLEDDEMAVVGE